METINGFLITLCALVYSGVSTLYELFLRLAKANIFSSNSILYPFIRRIYIVIGVIMLFFLAYSLLRSIVNPDGKNNAGTGKIIMNVVKAIVIIAVVPMAFEFAFAIQDALLEKNTIGKIILGVSNTNETSNQDMLGDDYKSVAEVVDRAGTDISVTIFEAFFYPYINEKAEKKYETKCSNDENPEECRINAFEYKGYEYGTLHKAVMEYSNFNIYKNYAKIINDESEDEYIVFNWVFALIAGGFCLFILTSYTLSLALRLIKLAYYELIAPIPAISDIVPGNQGMFNKWLKATIRTFVDSLLRIAILFFCVYIIRIICSVMNEPGNELFAGASVIQKKLLQALLIMGVIMFMKQAPELITSIFGGGDGKGYGFGLKDIKEKFAAGGGFVAGGVLGGAVSGAVKRGVAARKYYKEQKSEMGDKFSKKDAFKLAARGAGSTLGGLIGGGYRGGKESKDAKSWEDLYSGVSRANSQTDSKIASKYTALHQNKKIFGKDGRIAESTMDKAESIKTWAGAGYEIYQKAQKDANQILEYEKEARNNANSALAKFSLVGNMGLQLDGTDIKNSEGKVIGTYKDGVCTFKDGIADFGTFKGRSAALQAKLFVEGGGLTKETSLAEYVTKLNLMTKTDFSDAAKNIKIENLDGYKDALDKAVKSIDTEYKETLDKAIKNIDGDIILGKINPSDREKLYEEARQKIDDSFKGQREAIMQKVNDSFQEKYEAACRAAVNQAAEAYNKEKAALEVMIKQVQKETENQLIDNAKNLEKLKETFGDSYTEKDYENIFKELANVRSSKERIESKIKSMGGYISGTKNGTDQESYANTESSIKDIKDAAEALRDSNAAKVDAAVRRQEERKARKGN